jgi:hypothetical protein
MVQSKVGEGATTTNRRQSACGKPHQRTDAAAKDEIEQPCRKEGRRKNKTNRRGREIQERKHREKYREYGE